MIELIKIEEKEGLGQVVDARTLYDELEINTEFSVGVPRMLEYEFEQDKDFTLLIKNDKQDRGMVEITEKIMR